MEFSKLLMAALETCKNETDKNGYFIEDSNAKFYEIFFHNGSSAMLNQDYGTREFQANLFSNIFKWFKTNGVDLIGFKCVYSFGGEGQGDEYFKVIEFMSGTESALVQFDGYYQSYSGSDFRSMFLVEPYEYRETRYKEIK